MKGIYLLPESPKVPDYYWLYRARSVFEEVVVGFGLKKGEPGIVRESDIDKILLIHGNQGNMIFDFYNFGEEKYFFQRYSTASKMVFGKKWAFHKKKWPTREKVFRGTSPYKLLDVKLIIPRGLEERYSDFNQREKYFIR
jgi:hypothetical protein